MSFLLSSRRSPASDIIVTYLDRPHHEGLEAEAQRFRNRWHELEDRVDQRGAEARHERHAAREGRTFSRDGLPDPYSTAPGTCDVQVLRSICDWSHGQLIEHSIQNAYIQLINEANHYVYIGASAVLACLRFVSCSRIRTQRTSSCTYPRAQVYGLCANGSHHYTVSRTPLAILMTPLPIG